MFERFVLIVFTAGHIGWHITAAGVRVEHLAHTTTLLTGIYTILTNIVTTTVCRMSQGQVDTKLATRATEPIGQADRFVVIFITG